MLLYRKMENSTCQCIQRESIDEDQKRARSSVAPREVPWDEITLN